MEVIRNMAIDGVKIIDSDSAYDIYNPIMEMYHNGESVENIRHKIDNFEVCFTFDDLEYEIYITAYALAMWEIGALTDEQVQKIRDIVSKGASDLWNDVAPNAQKDRQKILIKFLQKIEQPNLKTKKRKNYKQITDFIFSPGDIIVFQFEDKTFGAAILVTTFQESRILYYAFAELALDEIILETKEKPSFDDVIWLSKIHASSNVGFGSIKFVSHKNLLTFKDKFDKIGSAKIREDARKLGMKSGGVKSFVEFCDNWYDGKGFAKNLCEQLEC